MFVMEKLNNIFFYHLDSAIRYYRQFAQNRLKELGFSITIDQWLVLKVLNEDPDVTQSELADKVLKDKASVTRILDILVEDKYLKREQHAESRRRYQLSITSKGHQVLKDIQSTVVKNRKHALRGVTDAELEIAEKVLKKITMNCKPE
jgi:MarR family transcriptional regulator for hemolysin